MTDEEAIIAIGVVMLIFQSSPDWGGGWVFPVPDRSSPLVRAEVSQEFKPGQHMGVDIMYREGGKWTAPIGTPVVAARSGVVWSVNQTPRGWNVVLDHGEPWATWYQHLASVVVQKGDRVEAGRELGVMGADPTDPQGLRHLHFAAWYKGNGDKASVDPQAAMKAWRRVTWT